jgi:hypothetical protein
MRLPSASLTEAISRGAALMGADSEVVGARGGRHLLRAGRGGPARSASAGSRWSRAEARERRTQRGQLAGSSGIALARTTFA